MATTLEQAIIEWLELERLAYAAAAEKLGIDLSVETSRAIITNFSETQAGWQQRAVAVSPVAIDYLKALWGTISQRRVRDQRRLDPYTRRTATDASSIRRLGERTTRRNHSGG